MSSPRAAVAVDGRSTDLARAVQLVRLYRSPVSHLLTDDAGRRVTTVQGPLTLELVAHHLDGRRDVGAVPLDVDKRCGWAALDVDHGGLEAARRLRSELVRQLGAATIFTSSGITHQDGYHVAVFFKAPVLASAVQSVLEAARVEAGVPGAEPIIAKGLRLPYYGRALEGRRVALDAAGAPMSLAAFLAAVARVPAPRLVGEKARILPFSSTHASLQSSCSLHAAPLHTRPAVLPTVPADLRTLRLRPARLVGLIHGGWFNGCGYQSRSAMQMAVCTALARAGHPPAMAWALLEASPRLRERASATGKAGGDWERSIQRAWTLVASTPDTRRTSTKPAPFTKVENRVLDILLTCEGPELRVYLDIVRHVNRHTGFAEVTEKRIGERIGCTPRHVRRGVSRLRKLGLVEAVPLEKRWPTGRRVVAYRPRQPAMTHRDE